MPLGVISHVFYSFAWVRPDGTVYLSDPWADAEMPIDGVKGCLNTFRNIRRENLHLKVILSVGGGGKGSENFASVAADPAKRNMFASSARELVVEYALDGIDIDWEHPSTAQEGHDYISLLATIRQYLPASTYILTSALPAGDWALQHIPLHLAHPYLNFINLMTYDFAGPWTPEAGHHAQLYASPRPHSAAAALCGSTAVTHVARQVPPGKLLLGIPTYGRSFLGARRPGDAHKGHAGEEGTFEFRELPRQGAVVGTDEKTVAAWCVSEEDGWVSYDNERTVRRKARWSRDRGLGGIFFWTGTGDREGGALVNEGFLGLHEFF